MSKPTGNVTIKSIAQALGISFSTVSKALNGDPAISPVTRKLVEDKAREMHYTRNYFAQNLRQKGSKTVAIIVNDIDIPAYGEMIAIISGKLATHGYTTIVSDSQYSEEFERASIQNVLSRMPEAVIIAPANPAGDNLKLLEPIYHNTLVLGEVDPQIPVSTLAVDHRLAGTLSAEHMLSRGVESFLVFGGPQGYQSSDLYLSGIADALEKAGKTLDPSRIHRFKPDLPTAYRRFMRLWQEDPESCNAVLCFCDSMALGIYRACRELELEVGKDVRVIGYDDGPANDFTDPPLTTVHMPKDLVATQCAQFVINRLVGSDPHLHHYRLQPYLAIRRSV